MAIVAADAEFGLHGLAKARAKMPRRPASPSSMTAGIHPQPPTSCQWCGRSGRQIRTLSSSAPIPPQLGRHGARGQRGRLQAENDRWRHGRPAERGDQGSARSATQRLDQLRLSLAVPKMQFAGVDDFDEEVPSARGDRRRGCAGLLHGAVGLCSLQVLQQAVVATTSLDNSKLGDYIRANTLKTVIGDVRFGTNGEGRGRACCRSNSRTSRVTTLPSSRTSRPRSWWHLPNTESGKLMYPYEKAR